MFTLDDPSISSIYKGFDLDDDPEIPITKMSKPLFSIVKGTGSNPLEPVPLDKASRAFIHVEIHNILKTYDSNGKETKVVNRTRVPQCTEGFLADTDFEK